MDVVKHTADNLKNEDTAEEVKDTADRLLDVADRLDLPETETSIDLTDNDDSTEYNSTEFIVECVNAAGMEGFEIGQTYYAEDHDDEDLLWVCDGNGEWSEWFGERFEAVENDR